MRTRWLSLALAGVGLSGCAVIAGYDFGKYSEAAGSGGAGGHGAGGATGSSSGPAGSTSSGVASSGATSSGATSSGAASSGAMTSGSSSGSSTGSSSSGTVPITSLVSTLVGPEGVAVDTAKVYFTTSNAATKTTNLLGVVGTNGLGYTMPVLDFDAAPAITVGGTGSGAYAAVTNLAGTGLIYSMGPVTTTTLTSDTSGVILGVAAWAANVYYTAGPGSGSLDMWRYQAGASKDLVPTALATGPIAADATGVYWATAGEIMRANTDGSSPRPLCSAPAAVSAITTDGLSFVYWTDQSGNVYRVGNGSFDGGLASPQSLTPDPSSPAYGIAVDQTGNIYFARGDSILRVQLPGPHQTTLYSGLAHPHGIALNPSANILYVAEHGNPPATDGAIVSFPVP